MQTASAALEEHWADIFSDNIERVYFAGAQAAGISKMYDDDELAQKWIQKSLQDIPENEKPVWEIYTTLGRALVARDIDPKSTFTAEELSQIQNQLQQYIQSSSNAAMKDKELANGLLYEMQQFVIAQLEAGNTEQAKDNLSFMEKVVSPGILKKEDRNSYATALFIAGSWKRLGETKKAEKLLQKIMKNVDPPLEKDQKITFISRISSEGFIDESLRLFRNLTMEEQQSANGFYVSLGDNLAHANPDKFPDKIFDDLTPHQKVQFLQSYVIALVGDTYSWEIDSTNRYFTYMNNSMFEMW